MCPANLQVSCSFMSSLIAQFLSAFARPVIPTPFLFVVDLDFLEVIALRRYSSGPFSDFTNLWLFTVLLFFTYILEPLAPIMCLIST